MRRSTHFYVLVTNVLIFIQGLQSEHVISEQKRDIPNEKEIDIRKTGHQNDIGSYINFNSIQNFGIREFKVQPVRRIIDRNVEKGRTQVVKDVSGRSIVVNRRETETYNIRKEVKGQTERNNRTKFDRADSRKSIRQLRMESVRADIQRPVNDCIGKCNSNNINQRERQNRVQNVCEVRRQSVREENGQSKNDKSNMRKVRGNRKHTVGDVRRRYVGENKRQSTRQDRQNDVVVKTAEYMRLKSDDYSGRRATKDISVKMQRNRNSYKVGEVNKRTEQESNINRRDQTEREAHTRNSRYVIQPSKEETVTMPLERQTHSHMEDKSAIRASRRNHMSRDVATRGNRQTNSNKEHKEDTRRLYRYRVRRDPTKSNQESSYLLDTVSISRAIFVGFVGVMGKGFWQKRL